MMIKTNNSNNNKNENKTEQLNCIELQSCTAAELPEQNVAIALVITEVFSISGFN